nr:MoxR family ATPase [Lachnospiraceae bacterium]
MRITDLKKEISKAIIGQDEVINQVILAMLSGGNVLLEGVPGLGKTQLIKTLSSACNLPFSRIQFTPDMMPADVTGTDLIIKKDGQNTFQFQPGPIFASFVLADEINRATPKTQAALLEAMQEHTVTVGNTTYNLEEPFMVLATQNPIENEGTYPLPEAQLDRFIFKIQVDFPTLQELKSIVSVNITNREVQINPVITKEDIIGLKTIVKDIPMADAVMDYAMRIVVATHPESEGSSDFAKKYISVGASPRAALAIVNTSKARAITMGRFNVSYEDVDAVAFPALRHRITPSFEAMADNVKADDIVKYILQNTTK